MHSPLRELAALFLKLGTTAFGGPAAHIAMMEDEVVTRRQWLTREAFLDLVSASNLIPGPNSTELAIHIGWQRARWAGLLVAGLAFILPAMVIVWVIAALYVAYGSLPAAAGLLAGVKPVVLAIVAVALWRLARTALHSAITLALAVVAALAVWFGVHELLVLVACGLVAWIDGRVTRGGNHWERVAVLLPAWPGTDMALSMGGGHALTSAPLAAIFFLFAKTGSVLFGSGYVLLAFLRSDFVVRNAWLTESQLLDAIAVGQFTPGPVFTTATFIGYLLAGNAGALLATVGIFLPAFVFVALSAPALARLRGNRDLRWVFDGLNAASLALMAVVTLRLAPDALAWRGGVAAVLFLAALVLTLRTRVNSAWLVLGGAIVGLLANR
ncbi:MAG: chromate efflux transporter [Gemmatimonadaceae bacterium]